MAAKRTPAAHPAIVRPFLKWAGGKRQLLPQLRRFYPAQFGRYWEPFLGSGAVFFDLYHHDRLVNRAVTLTDSNPDLMACYLAVREDVESVIDALGRLAAGHRRHGAQHYYAVRDRRFNPRRQGLFTQGPGVSMRYTPELAAMFIYLNRTGFNGLFRLNSNGLFNVPAGTYTNPRICDADNLRRVAAVLHQPGLRLDCAGFDRVLCEARPRDFLYVDPPYAPLSRTARFTSYTAGGFTADDQERLQQVIIDLAARGCFVVLSNSSAPEIAALYDGNAKAAAAGLRCHQIPARRAINSDARSRGPIAEYLITNVPEQAADLG
jgi:DNA adenine methylase